MSESILQSEIHDVARRGRPQKRWHQDVLTRLKQMKIVEWWEKAQRRDEWTHTSSCSDLKEEEDASVGIH